VHLSFFVLLPVLTLFALNRCDGNDAKSLLNAFSTVTNAVQVTDGFLGCFEAQLHLIIFCRAKVGAFF